jgi:hypothetical protein
MPENSSSSSSVSSQDRGPPIRTYNADDYDVRYKTSRLFQTVMDDHMLYRFILRWKEPRFPNYNTHTARLQSYFTWNHLIAPTPERLSAAGFLYTGEHSFEMFL